MLDLYAGSGAVGLEALSRGAAHALLVEADAKAARTISQNAETLGLAGAEVRHSRVERIAAAGAARPGVRPRVRSTRPTTLDDASLATVLSDLRPGWLADGAVVAVERTTRGGAVGLAGRASRRCGPGATARRTLWYGRATPGLPAPATGVEESPA